MARVQGENGYIKSYRSLLDWEWFTDGNTLRTWIYILHRANYEPSRFRGYEIGRGEFIESQEIMAKNIGVSRRGLRTALKHLKSTGEIDTQVTNYGTIIKVLKYAIYQDSD